jgi:pimeloyl-ACP methyl ester carboxylesterase
VAPSVPTLAAAVEEQLDRLGWETAHVAGNSLGGWVALELARRGRARTVVAIAPIGLGTDRENRRTRRRLRLVHVMGPAARPFVRPLARIVIGRTLLAAAGMQLARPWRHEPAEMVSALEQFWLAPGFSETFDWALTNRAEDLEQIRDPVTIVWGTRDLIAPPRQADRFASRIPQAQVRMLKGLGHDAMVDDSVVVAGAILQATAAGSREQLELPGRRR